MKCTLAIIAAAMVVVVTACNSGEAVEEGGNWYCRPVSHITYGGLDVASSYQSVSFMDSQSKTCNFVNIPYSGSIAPFDEELSVHVRGPLQLKSFAFYTPATASKEKKGSSTQSDQKRHRHKHRRNHAEKRQMVTATIDGKVVSWENNYFGPSTASTLRTASSSIKATPATTAVAGAQDYVKSVKGLANPSSGVDSESPDSTTDRPDNGSSQSSDWVRTAYYCAEDGTADGIAFLGNNGGQGSGVFDYTFGASLSYINENATAGAASPTVLRDALIGDGMEYSIWSDEECKGGDDACGYYRPGSVAHHGWAGPDKIFLFEFQMPMTGRQGANMDMPALWLLNAKIPRTQQYGGCSCWEQGGHGCGELDVLEVLSPGSDKCTSTFHFSNSIGSSDYFNRPTNAYIKVAVVFQSKSATASIKVLDSGTAFSSSLTAAQIDLMVNQIGGQSGASMLTIPQ